MWNDESTTAIVVTTSATGPARRRKFDSASYSRINSAWRSTGIDSASSAIALSAGLSLCSRLPPLMEPRRMPKRSRRVVRARHRMELEGAIAPAGEIDVPAAHDKLRRLVAMDPHADALEAPRERDHEATIALGPGLVGVGRRGQAGAVLLEDDRRLEYPIVIEAIRLDHRRARHGVDVRDVEAG